MKYITVTFDLTEDDYSSEKVDDLEKFLEDRGFVFESDSGEMPSTSVISDKADQDIDALRDEIVEFCQSSDIGLANLLVTSGEISHFVNEEFWDHDHDHDEE